MLDEEWIDVNIEQEMYKNWKRLFVKVQHSVPFQTHVDMKKLKSPLLSKGLSDILQHHPYNLRKLESRRVYENKKE